MGFGVWYDVISAGMKRGIIDLINGFLGSFPRSYLQQEENESHHISKHLIITRLSRRCCGRFFCGLMLRHWGHRATADEVVVGVGHGGEDGRWWCR